MLMQLKEVLYQRKYERGLDISSVFYKAQSIFASTFLKQFLNSDGNISLIKYNCTTIQMNPIFYILELSKNVSFIRSKLYDEYVILIRRLISVNNIPNVSSASIYSFLLPESQPTVISNLSID